MKVAPRRRRTPRAAPLRGASFCEKLYAPGEKPFKAPAERKLTVGEGSRAGASRAGPSSTSGRRGANRASRRCGNLGRWKDALAKDGNPINLELWSIDAGSDEDTLREPRAGRRAAGATFAGFDSEAAFGAFLEGVGLDKTAAIPIHILIDPAQNVRCVRVGAIHPEDFAQVKGVVSQR